MLLSHVLNTDLLIFAFKEKGALSTALMLCENFVTLSVPMYA